MFQSSAHEFKTRSLLYSKISPIQTNRRNWWQAQITHHHYI
jgi:hypothetical protein